MAATFLAAREREVRDVCPRALDRGVAQKVGSARHPDQRDAV